VPTRAKISFGYCQCGCGEPAPVSDKTDRKYGWVKGQPKRYIRGHVARVVSRERAAAAPKYPKRLCACGCGRYTKTSSCTDKKYGWVKGKPNLYLSGHRGGVRRTNKDLLDPKNGYYVVDARSGCWIWQRALTKHGYAWVRDTEEKKTVLGHRLFYRLLVGTIPKGRLAGS